MSVIPPRDWTTIHWPDADSAAAGEWIAVLPLAATEQHGPHLPVGTDSFIAEAYLARVQALLSPHIPASFLPVQNVGFSIEHIDYPGTVTLPYHVAIRHWMSLGESVARSGVKKIVMVTSHGGNSAPMAIVAQELRSRLGMLAVTTNWHRFGAPEGLFPDAEIAHGIHGGAVETSIMLAAQPDLVRQDKIANFEPASIAMVREFKWLSPHRPAPFAWTAQDLHPSGVAGDATLASADKGRQLIEHGAKAFCELLTDVHAFDMTRLANHPAV